jgi:hypothetical protein
MWASNPADTWSIIGAAGSSAVAANSRSADQTGHQIEGSDRVTMTAGNKPAGPRSRSVRNQIAARLIAVSPSFRAVSPLTDASDYEVVFEVGCSEGQDVSAEQWLSGNI